MNKSVRKLYKQGKKHLLLFLKGKIGYAKYLGVSIGNGCRILITNFGTEPYLVSIGNNVTIAPRTRIITHDGSAWLFSDEKGRRYIYQKIDIGDNVFIGMDCILLPGVKIGNNVIVGAGSVVTKSIPDNKIVGGNPARVIGDFNVYKEKALRSFVAKSDIEKGLSDKQRVLSIVSENFRPFLID